MALFFTCPHCHELNAVNNAQCWKCGHHLPSKGKGCRFSVIWREGGKKIRRALGVIPLYEARRIEAQIHESVRSGKHQVIEVGGGGSTTWKDVAEAYLHKLAAEDKNAQYQKDSRRYLEAFADTWGWDRPVNVITPAMIREVQVALRESGKSPAYCDRHLACGKAAWNHAASNIQNPFSQVKLYNPDNNMIRYLMPEQRERLLDAALLISRPLYEIIVVAMATGMRKSNVLQLRRDQVDLDNRLITVTQKGSRRHVIPIPQSLADLLRNIPESGTPWFWVSPRTGKPFHKDWRRTWQQAKSAAGIPASFRFHDLRHDAGTRILALTNNVTYAQAMLGHASVTTTMRYAHVMPEYLRSAVEAIDPLK